jgi:hypothetical protein
MKKVDFYSDFIRGSHHPWCRERHCVVRRQKHLDYPAAVFDVRKNGEFGFEYLLIGLNAYSYVC